ncbi:MAG: anthranilate phosphoribosyltransferase [Gammaproteobacteria bacterium]|nr:anthranilate phosphoribosyltransferase [Gammaproteobacteria bacterium]
MLKHAIEKLMQHQTLTTIEIQQAINELIVSDNDVQAGAFLSLLRTKGETVAEISTIVTTLRQHMVKVDVTTPVLDIVGSGGDGFNTINISTGSALLAAACGVAVAKHGNVASTSLCGAADVMMALGMNIDLDAAAVANSIRQFNFGFCFANNFHPAFKGIKQVRRKLALPTTFNMLGPLLNPASAQFLMIGLSDRQRLLPTAKILTALGTERALLFHCCGLDEIATVGDNEVLEIAGKKITPFMIKPEQYGFSRCQIDDLRGGNPQQNAQKLTAALSGQHGPIADTLILNAGLANHLYGLTGSVADGIALAQQKLDDGSAQQLIEQLIAYTQTETAKVGSVNHA